MFKTKPFRNETVSKHHHVKIAIVYLSSRTSCAQNENNAFPQRSEDSVCLSWRTQTPPSNHSTQKSLHILNSEPVPSYPYSTRTLKGLGSPTGFKRTVRVHLNNMNYRTFFLTFPFICYFTFLFLKKSIFFFN